MPTLEEILKRPLFANPTLDLLIAIGIVVGSFVLLLLLRRLVRRYHDKFRATERVELLEIPLQVLSRTALFFFVLLSLFLGLQTLTMGPRTSQIFDSLITIALFWQAGIWGVAAASAWLDNKRRRSLVEDRAAIGSLGIIGFIVNVVIWALVALLTLDNLGIDITASGRRPRHWWHCGSTGRAEYPRRSVRLAFDHAGSAVRRGRLPRTWAVTSWVRSKTSASRARGYAA